MSFFFSTPAGAIDAIALAIACIVAMAFGGAKPRALAGVVAAVYLIDRAIMAGFHDHSWPVLGAIVDFAALCLCLGVVKTIMGRAMAGLFLAKMAILAVSMVAGFPMGNAITVVVYLQLLLLLAGAVNGGLHNRSLRAVHRGGFDPHSGAIALEKRRQSL